MFKEIGYFSKVENLDIFRMIIDRLLYGLKLKWCDEVDKIIERIGREIIIEDVSDFVIAKVRVVIYVIFGDILSWLLLFYRNLREKK